MQQLKLLLCVVIIFISFFSNASNELIHINGPKLVAEYSDTRLTCSGTYAELKNSSVDWFFTSMQQGHYQPISADGTFSLPIRNMSWNDVGYYKCCLKDGTQCAHTVLTMISVQSGDLKIVSNAEGINGSLAVPGNAFTASFVHPPSNRTSWSIRNNAGYDCKSRHKEAYTCREMFTKTNKSLLIQNLKFKHSGWMTITGDVENTTVTYHINLVIHGKPHSLRMKNVSALRGDDSVEFVCQGEGYPRPLLVFSFNPCPSLDWNQCRARTTSIDILQAINYTTSPNDTIKFHVKANFELPSWPGIVRCTATNIEGTASTESLLFLRNFEQKMILDVTSPIGAIYDNERVDVRCRLDRYEFTKEITLSYNSFRKKLPDIEAEGENRYYWEAIHTLPGTLNSSEDNVVECHGVLRNGASMSENLKITVRHPIAPSIATIDGRNSGIVPIKRGKTLPLFCNVSGDPTPGISWSKNLIDLHNNSSSISATLLPNESLSNYRCEARNRFGNTSYIWKVIEERLEADTKPIWKTILPILLFMLVSVSICLIQPTIREKSQTVSPLSQTKQEETGNSIPHEFEFARNRLTLGKQIGQGQFGVVLLATAKHIIVNEAVTKVAVKMVRSTTNKTDAHEALISELLILVSIGQHLNVVNLLGAVTKHVQKAGTMVIFEYCPYGCLEQYLRENASKFIDCQDNLEQTWQYFLKQEHAGPNDDGKRACREFRTTDLICWAAQVANGMAYLADRNVVHGDLAARNVLLCYDNVVKIGDFGLAHIVEVPGQTFKRTNDRPLPVKWLALESLTEHVFSTKTDVWSYGVVLWEFFSLGATPYPGISPNECFLSKIRDGYRMDKPKYASEEIFDHMITCWYVNPQRRPSFKDLASSFNSMLPAELQNHYITMNEAYMEPYKLLKAANDAYVTALGAPSQPGDPSAFFTPNPDSTTTIVPKPFQTFNQTKPHRQTSSDTEQSFAVMA